MWCMKWIHTFFYVKVELSKTDKIVTFGEKEWVIAPDYTNFCPLDVPSTALTKDNDYIVFNFNPFWRILCQPKKKSKLGVRHKLIRKQIMFLPSHHAHAIYTHSRGGIGAYLQIEVDHFKRIILPNLYDSRSIHNDLSASNDILM